MLETPVLFLVFNRPDTTTKVFEKIKEVEPKQLFVACDGPRRTKAGEKEKVAEVRQLILENIDWSCEVHTLFREENLGCGKAVSSAITWFFEQVEEGIILEDDCLPNDSFFRFCEELLDYYREDERIMHISGDNFQNGRQRGNGNYYFSGFPHVWGWATWRRAWSKYSFEVSNFNESLFTNKLKYYFKSSFEQKYWVEVFQKMKKGEIDTWDYQWKFSIWINDGLTILPSKNLISNIGFAQDATHTKNPDDFLANLPVDSINSPLKHPKNQQINHSADRYTSKHILGLKGNNMALVLKFINSNKRRIYKLMKIIFGQTKNS